jgi:acetoin utilization protein AcuB
MLAKTIISKELPAVGWDESVDNVRSFMEGLGVEHLPVTRNGCFLGMVAREQLLDEPDPGKELSEVVSELERVFVPADAHIFDLLHVMASSRMTVVALVGEHDLYIGAVRNTDLLLAMDDLLVAGSHGSLLTLELNINDYNMGQIAQIVESDNARILSMNLRYHEDSTKMEIVLRINKQDVSAIIRTFERYDYHVRAHETKSRYKDDLRDRYDELMRYLSM